MGETEPAIHVAAHEGRILLGGAPDKLSNLVAVATKAALMDVGIAWLMELIVEWVGSGTPVFRPEEHLSSTDARASVGLDPMCEDRTWHSDQNAVVSQSHSSVWRPKWALCGRHVELGLVKGLARPGGNVTGVTFEAAPETNAKRLQLLREIVPTLKRLVVLGARGDPNVRYAPQSETENAADPSQAVAVQGDRHR